MMKKKMSWILVLVGLSIIAYPSVNKYTGIKKQAKLFEEMKVKEETLANESALRPDANFAFETVYPIDDYDIDGILKIIKIPAIDLTVPFVDGISDANLKIAPARFESSKKPGEMGNFALAGHRYYTYGRDFNRLGEIEVGDEIEIIVGINSYTYTVTEIFIVEPEDVWVLNDIDGMRIITLVTCTPIRIATHRLIIRGELTNYKRMENRKER